MPIFKSILFLAISKINWPLWYNGQKVGYFDR